MDKGAILSNCGTFRYRLWRRWDAAHVPVGFVMLNPSTADAEHDDPTIRKCIGFARRWGFGGIEVVNLYAYRATDPKALRVAGWPKGPENDRHIVEATGACGRVVCAWGANARGMARPAHVLGLLREVGAVPMALALTDDGIPKHPLYIPYEAVPKPLLPKDHS